MIAIVFTVLALSYGSVCGRSVRMRSPPDLLRVVGALARQELPVAFRALLDVAPRDVELAADHVTIVASPPWSAFAMTIRFASVPNASDRAPVERERRSALRRTDELAPLGWCVARHGGTGSEGASIPQGCE